MTARAPLSPAPAPAPAPASALAAEAQARSVADRALAGPVAWRPLSPGPGSEPLPSVPGAGEALAPGLRTDMERRLGGDLSGVRVHRDLAAERAAEAQDANAFAIGRDVYFGRGAYSPETSDGRRLLAHELAHTVQQSGAGLLNIQREDKTKKKKAPPGPPDSIAKLTDAEKVEMRARFAAQAAEAYSNVVDYVDRLPNNGQLSSAQKATIDSVRQKLAATRAGASQVPDAADKAARLAMVAAAESVLNDKYFQHYLTTYPKIWNLPFLDQLADPARKLSAEDSANLARETALLQGGAKAIITGVELGSIYHHEKIDPEWLKTEDLTAEEAAEKGAPKDTLTAEDKQRLQDIYSAVPDGGENRAVVDPKVLAEKLRDLSPEDIEQLKAFLRQSPPQTDVELPPIEEQLEQFKKLTPTERDTLLVNQELKADSPSQTKLDGKVLLDLAKADAPLKDAATTFDNNMQLVASLITDPDKVKKYNPISIDVGLFALEMAFFRGLLAGGAARSELVRGAVTDLTAEMARAQQELQEELIAEAALAALVLVPGIGQAKLLLTLAKLERLRRKIDKIRKAYAVYDQVKNFIDIVAAAPQAIAEFRGFIDQASGTYADSLKMLAELEGEEGIDEKVAEFEDQLAEKFEALLDTKFGDVLEMLYLPPDASPEELLRIIFELPKGIDALDDAWQFYQNADADSAQDAERVLVRAAKAGALLYPLVGFLAAFGAEQIGAAFPDRDVTDHLLGKLSGYKKKPKERRDANRGAFFRLNRKNYDYNEADLKPFLDKGATRLAKLIEDDEPGQHWTAGWLRVTLRDEVKNLNREFSKETVPAKVKEKKAKGSKKKSAAPARTETVPLPPFRLKFVRNDKDPQNETVELHLNPVKPLKFDTLSYPDFKTPEGVPFKLSGKAKRDKALRSWLDDREFVIVPDNDGNPHIRLRGGNTPSTTTGRVYLHIDASGTPSKLREGIHKDDYKKFLGRQVDSSEDLPEGFYLKETSAGATVSRKRGVRTAQEAPMLGFDSTGKLTDTNKATLGPETKAAPGVTEPADADLESYDWQAALATTISGGDYNRQEAWAEGWNNRADRNPDIKKRPKRVSGDLGYILRARAFGDKLSSAHLPELKNSDDKGHLVAKRFGGTDHVRNLVPMKRSVNQFPGKWFSTESDIAKVYTAKDAKPGHRAHLSIEIDYPHGRTRRPSRFRVEWKEHDATGKPVSGKGSGKKIPISNT